MKIYLYVKRHIETGLLYFGKTVKNPYKYNGSGLRWKRHLRKHKAAKDLQLDMSVKR